MSSFNATARRAARATAMNGVSSSNTRRTARLRRVRADDARPRRVDERLAASRQRIEQGNDRALVIGARGIDDDVGGSALLVRELLASSSAPSTGSMPRARTASALSRERTRPVT